MSHALRNAVQAASPRLQHTTEPCCYLRQVTVYRLVTSGTVDQDIHAIAQRKLRLDAAVLAGGDDAEGAAEGKASGKAGAERTAMSVILSSILNGKSIEEEPAIEVGSDGDDALMTKLPHANNSTAVAASL